MSDDPEKLMREKIGAVKSRDKTRRRIRGLIAKTSRDTMRRPGHGTGTSADDLWTPSSQSDAYVPEDDRIGRILCQSCGMDVRHVEIDGRWYVRNLDDDLPHALSCEGED